MHVLLLGLLLLLLLLLLGLFVFFILNLVEVVDGAAIAPTRHAILAHGLQDHALLDALLKSTILTPVALRFGYFARAIGHAGVHASVLHGALKEAFTAFTRDDAIM